MIVDVHTHLMWYPEHTSEEWASEALASKLVKLK
jgi:imidazolonepropionase-like amidohydrolase